MILNATQLPRNSKSTSTNSSKVIGTVLSKPLVELWQQSTNNRSPNRKLCLDNEPLRFANTGAAGSSTQICKGGSRHDGYQRISNCLDGKTESFIKWDVHRYPENMLHAKRGHPTVVRPCDRGQYRALVSIVMHRVNKGTLIVSSGVGSAPEG